MTATTARIKALDLFAGTGWGVACQWLGIKEAGVELMDEAVATREANGMHTIYRDVWDGLELTEEEHRESYGSYGLLIASPPCQTFSLAGKGAGRAALNDVLEAIELHAYKDALALRAFGEKHDPRTALVLTPLAYVWRDRPRLVALEQVPTVLPVWEACAEVMREWGYDVKVEILNAEQYGVPQTRRRAILVARRGGPVHMPIPTHSKYYSTNPSKLDPGVRKWISMAEALGWGDVRGSVAKGVQPNSPMRSLSEPAVTLAFGHDSASFVRVPEGVQHADLKKAKADGTAQRLTVDEAAALQSYPTGRGLTNRPSPTITGGGTEAGGAEPIAKFHERYTNAPGWVGSTERLTTEEAAALQSYPAALRAEIEDWKWKDMPATTIAGDPRITAREHHYHGEQSKTSLRLTLPEAEALQSYPRPFVWCGNKGKQFLQIGNAVPPVLAEAILAALIGIRPGR